MRKPIIALPRIRAIYAHKYVFGPMINHVEHDDKTVSDPFNRGDARYGSVRHVVARGHRAQPFRLLS